MAEGASRSFVHLHVHSEFSLLDGASRISAPADSPAVTILDVVESLGMPAIGMTDHGVMFGALDFYRACRGREITPILGVEAYVAPGSRFDRTPGENEEKYRHLTILARNETGYRNLLRLVTESHLEGFYHRPRIDKDLLAERAEGLIGFTGCLAGEVCRLLLAGQERRAYDAAAVYRDLFGRDGFYVELQDHGLAEQREVNPRLVKMARDLDIPLVATNDAHYTERGHARAHDVLLCIQQPGKVLADSDRLKFDTEEFYVKSAEEMRDLFRDYPEACDATLDIADSVEAIPALERPLIERSEPLHVPRFEPPDGLELEDHLRDLAEAGAGERYGEVTPEVRDRLEHELRIICDMGFAGYFLIVWDLIRFAREHGIRVGPGRGSAAGSVVSYSLRITDLDPLRYGLIFERFLNPERKLMPDIDMDFDERRRDEVIRYVGERYGHDHVAQIITFQTIKGKQGIRDAARVLGFPASVGDRLCKMYPPALLGREYPIGKALELSRELAEAYDKEAEAREIVDTARELEYLRREDSVHAAGVVIGDRPLVNYLPLKLAKDSRDDSRRIVTQFDMHGVEDLGLLKMDFLGLRNLSVIEDALRMLRAEGTELDVDHLPLEDEATYEMLRSGDTTGVFQLEGAGMRSLIRQLAPDRFEDLMALVALYRPGPLSANMHVEYAERKHGRKPVTYPHADLEPVLASTYGVIVYQEQVMEIAVRMAGYTMGQADFLRKAMGKKIREELIPHRETFVRGAVANGYSERLAQEVFDLIVPFADYGFNASHACGYALIAYQTAYLKAHHPVEYMAALLTSVKDDKDKKPFYLNACRLMGITVLPPDVNASDLDFTPAGDAIRYGLSAVRNVGAGAVGQITEARRTRGSYSSFTDFCRKVDPAVLHRKALESLILAGAFDSLGYTRRGLLDGYEKILGPILSDRRAETIGQGLLLSQEMGTALDIDESVLAAEEFDKSLFLTNEKQMLGQYVTDHPLLGVRERLEARTDMEISELPALGDGDVVRVGGIITAMVRRFSRRGEPYVVFRLEDLAGGVQVVAFPSVFEEAGDRVAPDRIVLVRGRIDLRGRELQIVAQEIGELEGRSDGPGPPGRTPPSADPLLLSVPTAECTNGLVTRLKQTLAAHPGGIPVVLRLVSEERNRSLRLSDGYRVDASAGLMAELRTILGGSAVARSNGSG
ncbi:MAG TPA: DNA polymerase III subunit alpha [Actinomycetota bacterium]|nr:DNA polymerase III subunit alpha [Actinomycetota bacterium]